MSHIFISYSKKNIDFARHLRGLLQDQGFAVWMDETKIVPSQRWWPRIEKNIETCAAFIVVMSPEARESDWVEREILVAEEKENPKPIFPILLSGKPWRRLANIQYADMTAGTEATLPIDLLHGLQSIVPAFTGEPAPPPLPEREDTVLEEAAAPKPRTRLIIGGGVGATLVVILAIVALNSGIFSPFGLTDTPTPDLNATVAARQTANAAATAAAASPTPSHTPQPTEDTDATINAIILATDQHFVGQTVTATHLTPPPTATPTPYPAQAALQRAQNFSGGNRDWQPFAKVFPDDPAGAEMMLVPVGEFMMGSDDGEDDEKPPHPQIFDEPFWIDRTEVTRAMYSQCVAAGECTTTSENQYSTRDGQPINRVTWFQARDYCEWRGRRLPAERKWEYVARGPDNWIYPWGDEFVAGNGVYGSNSGNTTADVGSKEQGASWVGALDMSGNVWEWVSSIYQPYPYKADDGRESNENANSARVLRGGSFYGLVTNGLRAANRYRDFPTYENDDGGFRCARSYNSES